MLPLVAPPRKNPAFAEAFAVLRFSPLSHRCFAAQMVVPKPQQLICGTQFRTARDSKRET
jgi:hypothetical protein